MEEEIEGKNTTMEVYYVEDDRDIAQSVKTYLEIRQLKVSVFYSIADAKQALLRQHPAIILVDRSLCEMGDEISLYVKETPLKEEQPWKTAH